MSITMLIAGGGSKWEAHVPCTLLLLALCVIKPQQMSPEERSNSTSKLSCVLILHKYPLSWETQPVQTGRREVLLGDRPPVANLFQPFPEAEKTGEEKGVVVCGNWAGCSLSKSPGDCLGLKRQPMTVSIYKLHVTS